jgi:hypothetical protein
VALFGDSTFESRVMARPPKWERQSTDVIVGELMDRLRHNGDADELISRLGDGLREDKIEHPQATTGEHIDNIIREDPELFDLFKRFVTDAFDEGQHFRVWSSPIRPKRP